MCSAECKTFTFLKFSMISRTYVMSNYNDSDSDSISYGTTFKVFGLYLAMA
jgi:hypothetical protein